MNVLDILDLGCRCYGCYGCKNICPTDAIELKTTADGFRYPVVNKERCVDCGLCYKACPLHLAANPKKYSFTAFYGKSRNEILRAKSSSGGAFGEISKLAMEKGGTVFGAYFNTATKTVMHSDTTRVSLEEIMQSKYVQSDIDDAFSRIKERLAKKETVVFCGTPCQVAGLNLYLGKEYPTLLTIDFVCHGVPSPALMHEMLTSYENKHQSIVKDVRFRDKTNGWRTQTLNIIFENNTQLSTLSAQTAYYFAFLQNYSLRKSCFSCKFSNYHVADITLADFWQVHKQNEQLDDDKGISLLLINTQKGIDILPDLREKMLLCPLDAQDASYCLNDRNQNKYYNIKKRNRFFALYSEKGYTAAMTYIKKQMFLSKTKRKIVHIRKILLGR